MKGKRRISIALLDEYSIDVYLFYFTFNQELGVDQYHQAFV